MTPHKLFNFQIVKAFKNGQVLGRSREYPSHYFCRVLSPRFKLCPDCSEGDLASSGAESFDVSAWKDRAGLVLWVQQQTATAELQDRGDESCCVYYGINTREGGWRKGGGGGY